MKSVKMKLFLTCVAIFVLVGFVERVQSQHLTTSKPVGVLTSSGFVSFSELDAENSDSALSQALAATEFTVALNASTLYVTTVKDAGIPVKATVNLASGGLSLATAEGQPALDLQIDLNTFNSGLELRDDRVRRFFFNADQEAFKTARLVVAALPMGSSEKLKLEKKILNVPVSADFTLRGKTQKISGMVNVFFNKQGRLQIKTAKPFAIKFSELALSENLEKLKVICGHQSIADDVKVDVDWQFDAVK